MYKSTMGSRGVPKRGLQETNSVNMQTGNLVITWRNKQRNILKNDPKFAYMVCRI